MQKKRHFINIIKRVTLIITVLATWNVSSQIYFHDFGTQFITEYPYTAAPNVIDEYLSNSQWTNYTGEWVSFVGITGEALGLSNASGAASVTLTFDVVPGKELEIESFSFWRKRTNSGPQNWSMAINGITVGNGTTTTAGSDTGTLAVANEVSGLTGTVNIVISLSTSIGVGSFMVDDFTLNGTVSDAPVPCTPPVVSSIAPQNGPAGTVVTITGSGFEAGTGTTSVQFNGVEAAGYTVISDTEIKATVPATGTTGAITLMTDDCNTDSDSFTVLDSDCPETSGPEDIYISELYDHVPGSYGMIELYNPTGNVITFNGEYVLQRAGDIGGAPSYTLTLSGSIGPESTYLVQSGTGAGCTVLPDASMGQGINDNDEFKILKNGNVIDIAQAPTYIGYTVIRQSGAIAPSATYNNSDWTFTSNNCADLGSHTADFFPPGSAITLQPESVNICEGGEAVFTVAVSNEAGFTYQWKTTDESGNWTDVVNNADITGATTATLTISNAGSNLNNAQFYCEISSVSCSLISNAVQLTIIAPPVLATTTVTQPTCDTPTGVIEITSPTGNGLTYSINGTDFQAETVFAGLNPGTYIITVQNADGCESITGNIIINAVPNAPAVATTIVTQPTCEEPTGAIEISTPTGAGLTYSIDGTNFQDETTFEGLAPGTYTITVQNANGCESETNPININAVPNAPAVATTTVIQPTCDTPTGIIEVTNPTGTGLTYSINGTDFQSGTVFAGLNPGTYTITVQNADGCISATAPITINTVPNAPAIANTTVTQPTCETPTGVIEVTNPTGTGLTYSINGTDFQSGTVFEGLNPGTYTITVQNADGCTSVTAPIIINTVPNAPAITGVQGCREESFGSSYILEVLASDNSFDINSANFEWQNAQGAVIGTNNNIFNVTQYATDNNIPAESFPLKLTVIVTNQGGCQVSYTFTVETYFCTIPRGISPNNDGMNDSFDITGLNARKLTIFNRYGKQVYSMNNYRNEWFGQSDNGDELPTGTYYYVIDSDTNPTTGWVYINRQN